MNFFWLILGIFLIGTVASLLRRRGAKSPSRSGRYRSPLSTSSLNLERPGPARSRRGSARSSALAGPIFMGLVLLVMTFWLVAAFFLPEGEKPSMVAETQADAAYPEQALSLAGRLSAGRPPLGEETGVMAQAAQSAISASSAPTAAPAPAPANLTAAARAMVTVDSSRFEQVGLLPAQTPVRPSAPPPPAPAPAALPAPPAARSIPAATATVSSPARAPANPLPARAAASLPLTAASAKPPLATNRPKPSGDALLSGSREFTVHLASFNDRENAEKYKDQLAASGEQAFISEVTMDGRRWHRVMSGRFGTRDEAEAYGRDLKRRSLTAATGTYLIKPVE